MSADAAVIHDRKRPGAEGLDDYSSTPRRNHNSSDAYAERRLGGIVGHLRPEYAHTTTLDGETVAMVADGPHESEGEKIDQYR